MTRGLWVQRVAGRQYVWVVITGSYNCFKNTSAWPEHTQHTFPLPIEPSCVSINTVSLAPALVSQCDRNPLALPNLPGVLD